MLNFFDVVFLEITFAIFSVITICIAIWFVVVLIKDGKNKNIDKNFDIYDRKKR